MEKIDYSMNIATNDSDNTQSRIVIEVNGFEIDILADSDGIAIDVQKANAILTCLSWDWDTAEDKANANLIAAAPDLLAALEEMLKPLPRLNPGAAVRSREKAARAAIEKARGQS